MKMYIFRDARSQLGFWRECTVTAADALALGCLKLSPLSVLGAHVFECQACREDGVVPG